MAENERVSVGSLSTDASVTAGTTIDVATSSAPSAPAGKARLYFDTGDNKLKIAENGGSFVNVVGGSSASEAQQRFALQAAKQSNAGTYEIGSWSIQTSAKTQSWESVCWSPELGMFCAVSSDGGSPLTTQVMTSMNGVDWTLQNSTLNSAWASVCWADTLGLFVAVDIGTPHSIHSADGVTWAESNNTSTNTWTSVCWSHELGLLVTVAKDDGGASPSTRVMTSTNAQAWTNRTPAEVNAWQSVCWSAEKAIFVAVSSDGTHRVMTSPNGVTWTAQTAATQDSWMTVCWSPELNLFVALSSDGTTMSSPDGVTWTSRSISGNTWHSVCWAAEVGYFVAVALNGSFVVSKDGILWSDQSVPEANQWSSVCWAPELCKFVVVARNGTHQVLTSRSYRPDPVVQSNGTFAAVGDAITKTFVIRGTTTDGSPLGLTPDGVPVSQLLVMPNFSTWNYNVRVVAQSVPSGKVAMFELNGGIWRAANAASTALMDTPDQTFSQKVSNTWTVDIIAETSQGALFVQVAGEAATTVQWVAKVEIVQTFATS